MSELMDQFAHSSLGLPLQLQHQGMIPAGDPLPQEKQAMSSSSVPAPLSGSSSGPSEEEDMAWFVAQPWDFGNPNAHQMMQKPANPQSLMQQTQGMQLAMNPQTMNPQALKEEPVKTEPPKKKNERPILKRPRLEVLSLRPEPQFMCCGGSDGGFAWNYKNVREPREVALT